jgi:hypothetical protein
MQVFFLIAGFFARMVRQKRGRIGFAAHRLRRIALPFVAGWIVMYPLFKLYYLWGGLTSGRIQSDEPFWDLFVQHFRGWHLDWFNLTHLWFLYYLVLLYAVALAGEALCANLLDRKGNLTKAVGRLFRRTMESRWNIVLLTIPLWAALWWNRDFFGITTPSASFAPMWSVLIAYALFFVVGWLLHAQSELLPVFDRRWATNIVIGTVVSVPLFLYFDYGVSQGKLTSIYPFMWDKELRDYSTFREQLLAAAENEDDSPKRLLWEAFSPEYQRFIRDHERVTTDEQAGLVFHLNQHVIPNPKTFDPKATDVIPSDERLQEEAVLHNRKTLEEIFPTGVIAENGMKGTQFEIIRFFFMGGYALSTWLLIFGFVGMSNRLFANPNRTVRYIADSSYWLYIIHLPILFHINILVADAEWHWLPKFLLYNLLAFAIMLPSYHYLVRSTWIGALLNGRRYAFRPWFRRPVVSPSLES